MNLESVLGESLQHYGIKRNVPFTNRSGSTRNVNFEVIDTKRAILSVHKGCGSGSSIVFTPDGKGKIVNDTKCTEKVKQIMGSTPGFDIVYDRGTYVLEVDVNDGVHVDDERRKFEERHWNQFPVIRKKSIGNEPSTKHSKTMNDSKEFNKMSMVRINTHLSKSR